MARLLEGRAVHSGVAAVQRAPRLRVTWMPWGPQTQGLLIYRHMLPRPRFRQAIQNVGEPGNERRVMGRFYPRGRYFAGPADFEKRGCGRK